MGYRKEYRMMTDMERDRFHEALRVLKNRGEYDRFAFEHRAVSTENCKTVVFLAIRR